jgi:hypothetical protein
MLDAEGRRRAYSEELLRMYGAAIAWHAVHTSTPNISIGASRFVTIKLAAMITGLTEKAIRRKIERGIWLEGKHFRRADGGIYIDIREIEKWVLSAH